jgi:hypothetical protein
MAEKVAAINRVKARIGEIPIASNHKSDLTLNPSLSIRSKEGFMTNPTANLLKEINRGQNGQPIFQRGKKYTLFRINWIAMTCKQEIIVVDFDKEGNPIYKEQGKRKLFVLILKEREYVSAPEKMFDGMVFEGDLDFSCDSDSDSVYFFGRMAGNALFNFVGNIEVIKKTIQEKQLNPWVEIHRAIHVTKEGVETVLFPELYQGGHAVIDRMLNSNIS